MVNWKTANGQSKIGKIVFSQIHDSNFFGIEQRSVLKNSETYIQDFRVLRLAKLVSQAIAHPRETPPLKLHQQSAALAAHDLA